MRLVSHRIAGGSLDWLTRQIVPMVVGWVILFGYVDTALTLSAVGLVGPAVEQNPAMAALINVHPGLFGVVKVVVVTVVGVLLLDRRDELARHAMFPVATALVFTFALFVTVVNTIALIIYAGVAV